MKLFRISCLFIAAWVAGGCLSVPPVHPEEPPLPPQPVRVQMLFTGDFMQHLPQVQAARTASGFDYAPVLAAVRPRFDSADLVVVNLETTLTRSTQYAGYPCFRSPIALAEALRDAGVDVALMANNHCCDGGLVGIRTTTEVLDSCGLLRTGVYVDSLDRVKHDALVVTRKEIPIGILNYTYGTNGLRVPAPAWVNRIDTVTMAADVAEVRKRGARCVVACVHWGNEYQRKPCAEQQAVAAALMRAGVDVIIGSHPHVVQPVEADSAHVIYWSLGNFVSNQRFRYSDGGIMAVVTLTEHPDGHITFETETIPVWVRVPGYQILPLEVADTMELPKAYATFRADISAMLEP